MRRRNVLVFRTARTLESCLERIHGDWPEADVWVVHTPGCEDAIRSLGMDPSHSIVFSRARFFSVFKFLTSRTFLRVIRRRYFRVVVLYADINGNGYGQLDAIARLVGRSRAVAFTPNGQFIQVSSLYTRLPELLKSWVCSTAAAVLFSLLVDIPVMFKRAARGAAE